MMGQMTVALQGSGEGCHQEACEQMCESSSQKDRDGHLGAEPSSQGAHEGQDNQNGRQGWPLGTTEGAFSGLSTGCVFSLLTLTPLHGTL